MTGYSYPNLPILTLAGKIYTNGSQKIDPYGISDSTGLGPNGANIYRTFRTVIESIEPQYIGDHSTREMGQYNGADVNVGDFISNDDATRIFRISKIYKKNQGSLDILYEDVWMSIAKSRADRVNFLDEGNRVIIFKVTEDNIPLIDWSGTGFFTNTYAIDRLQTYFRVYQPSKHFTFYSVTGANLLSPGDLVTATGGTGDASLIKIDSKDQIIVGQVYQVFGGNNVIINSNRRIITDFPDPPGLTAGKIGDIWYSDEAGRYNLTSTDNKPEFFQLTNAISTTILGETQNPTFNQKLHNLVINGVEVITKDISGNTVMPLADIVNNINNFSSQTHTIASDFGGLLKLDRYDGGDIITQGTWVTLDTIGKEVFNRSSGTPPYVMLIDSIGTKGSTGNYYLSVMDEGNPIGNYNTMNFIGNEVYSEDSGIPGQVNVYILPPTFASHYNTTDGTTNGLIIEDLERNIVRISTPTSEGNPFKTNGWEATNKPATDSDSVIFSTSEHVTGFSAPGTGDSIIRVTVYDADGISKLAEYQTPVINQDGFYFSSGDDVGITVIIVDYSPDTTKYKANVIVSVNMGTIFGTHSLDGGRYHVKTEHVTDTDTDGGLTYTHIQEDVFYDTDSTKPIIYGNMDMKESTDSSKILTKHISGIEYYILSSEFETNIDNIDNLNQNTQGRNKTATYNFKIAAPEYGLPTRELEAWNLGPYGTWNGTWNNNWNLMDANYQYTNWPITSNNFRYRGPSANGTVNIYDPWGIGNTRNSPGASILVDTFIDNSTRLGEDFDGESKRLFKDSNSYLPWDSTQPLANSINGTGSGSFCDACVVGSNVIIPNRFFLTDPSINTIQPNLIAYKPNKSGVNPNYSGLGDIAVFHRKFWTSPINNNQAISSFIMSFGGDPGPYNDFSHALENSGIRVYIRRAAVPTNQLIGDWGFYANPLSLHGELFNSGAPANPFDDGASGVDTPGSFIRTINGGNSIPGTFGTGMPAASGFFMELQIVNSDIKIDYINVTLIFSNGVTDSVPV